MSRLILVLLCSAVLLPAQYDVLIRNARIVDGAGNPWYRGDVAVKGDSIAALGTMPAATASRVIDAGGRVVAPGFIDPHTHARRGIIDVPTAENYIRQGVTTLIEGNDGSSPLPLDPFLEKVAGRGVSVNFASFVGQGSIRREIVGLANRRATPEELEKMKALVRRGMEDGALGLSTGLFYVPGNYTPTEEVIELAKVAGEMGGMYISHMRNESDGLLDSVRETIAIGEKGHLPSQITHHKAVGVATWGKSVDTLKLVEEARARGVDVTIDQYPYTASSTGLTGLVPQWAQEGGEEQMRQRFQDPATHAWLRAEMARNIRENRGGGDPKNVVLANCPFDASLNGKSLADVARSNSKEPTAENASDAAMDLLMRGSCQTVYHAISEPDVERIMKYPWTMIGSDGEVPIFGHGVLHPRSYGTFARVLGVYVRERKILTLEDAIRKMSSFPAQRLRLMDRGLLRPGMKADLVIFDPETVADRAVFGNPHQYAAGFSHVMVNGELVIDDGKVTERRPGRILRGPAAKR